MNNIFKDHESTRKVISRLVKDYRRIDRFIESTESAGVYISADVIGAMNSAKNMLLELFQTEEEREKDYVDTDIYHILEAQYLNDDEVVFKLLNRNK